MDEARDFGDWLRVERRAAETLRPDAYARWCFIVGTGGTPQERARRGERALRHLSASVVVHVEAA